MITQPLRVENNKQKTNVARRRRWKTLWVKGNCAKYPPWGSKPHKTVAVFRDISVSYVVIDTLSISIFIRFLHDLIRSMWQRAGAVRLFVEHVILLNESDDDEVHSESVVTLWKVFANASYEVINQNKRKMKQPEFIF